MSVKWLLTRLRNKIVSLWPILAGALVIFVLMYGLVLALAPVLPETYDRLSDWMSRTDLPAAQEELAAWFAQWGSRGWMFFILLQTLQVLLAPIPGQLVGFAGGFLFGFGRGLLLSMIGLGLGSFIAMGLSRMLKEGLARKFVPPRVMARFEKLISGGGLFDFLMIFLLPFFPDDAVCFMAGLTGLRLWKLMVVCFLGRLPGMAVLALAGANLGRDILMVKIIFFCSITLAGLVWLFDGELLTLLFGRHHRGRGSAPKDGRDVRP